MKAFTNSVSMSYLHKIPSQIIKKHLLLKLIACNRKLLYFQINHNFCILIIYDKAIIDLWKSKYHCYGTIVMFFGFNEFYDHIIIACKSIVKYIYDSWFNDDELMNAYFDISI